MAISEAFTRWASPAYLAAVALVAIQVSIGLLFKAVQVKGGYSFSTSSSITISEFFKFTLSTIFFYRTCSQRHRSEHGLGRYQRVDGESGSCEESRGLTSEDKTSTPSDDFVLTNEKAPTWTSSTLSLPAYFRCCVNETTRPTIYGYGQLAFLYALINNTVFVLYRLADPGTIQLIKSGITLVTAITSLVFLGSKIAKTQWLAIILQICGLVVTQYHPDTGSTYPLPSYAILFFQTIVTALAGVFNQHLLKSQEASLHAQNMVLYAFGVAINLSVHGMVTLLKPEEPGFFVGYGHIGAVLVIVSNVLNGLVITAVYKCKSNTCICEESWLTLLTDADAIVKCFATAVSTAILLYLAPLLFRVDFSLLVVPGTAVVFVATWIYMEAAPRKAGLHEDQLTAMPTEENTETQSSSWRTAAALFTPWGSWAPWGLLTTACTITAVIASLSTWNIGNLQNRPHRPGSQSTSPHSGADASPFENTVGFVRWNAPYLERVPLIEKYEPFFHTIHYSIPSYPSENTTFLNLTHSSWDNHENVYRPVARLMSLILSRSNESSFDESYSSISGVLFFHFDAWIDPSEFEHQDFSRVWYPDYLDPSHNCYDNAEGPGSWIWWHTHHLWDMGVAALDSLNDTKYASNKTEVCTGWSDIYYIPRRYFEDFIFLAKKFDPMFHESAIPTMLNVIEQTYREQEMAPQVLQLADCWGGCCSDNPSREDILFHRCGHKLNYLDPNNSVPHYEKLGRQASLLGYNKSRQAKLERSVPLF